MSSYNNIEKIKYTKNQQDVVALKEYIVFDDEAKQEKLIVFKFINNLNQNLYEIKFEVSQYDENENLIGKSTLIYDNFTAESYETFVPNAKMKVLYACKSISVKLLFARFVRVTWENDMFKDIPYSFEECKSQNGKVTNTVKSKSERKDEKYEVRVSNKEEKSRRKRSYLYKEVKKAHRARFPKFFHVFFSVIVGGALVLTTVMFNRQSDVFTIGDYDVRQVGVGQYSIVKYDGFDKDVIIPTEINGNAIVKIEEGAFKFSNVRSVSIEHNVDIRSKAFQYCNNLKTISSSCELNIPYLAFFRCSNIENIYVPYSDINQLSFFGSKNIKQLTFDECYAEKLSHVFANEGSGKVDIDVLYTNMKKIKGNFFDDCNVEKATFSNEEVTYEYGALSSINQSGVEAVDGLEIENGNVVAVDYEGGCVTISPMVTSFDLTKFDRLNEIHTLRINNNNLTFSNEFFRTFSGVHTLEIDTVYSLGYDAFANTSIKKLIAPLSYCSLSTYAINSYINELVVKTGDCDVITNEYFANIPTLTSIEIDTHVSSIGYSAFNGLYSLSKTDLVLNNASPLDYQYSNLQNLQEVNVLYNHGVSTIPSNVFVNLNNLRKATFAEGFTSSDSFVVDNQYALESITFPKSLSYVSYPVIGTNNFNLYKVELTCNNMDEYTTYSNVNLSAEYTRELKLNCAGLPGDFFKEKCAQITHLCIDGDYAYSPIGQLSNCTNLSYLDIRMDMGINYISDLFADNSDVRNNVFNMPISLNVVSLSKIKVGEYFFTGCKYISEVYLLNVGKVKKNIFDNCISLRVVYLSNACNYPNALLKNLNKIAGINVLFQGKSPKKRKSNYVGNYDIDNLLHWEG